MSSWFVGVVCCRSGAGRNASTLLQGEFFVVVVVEIINFLESFFLSPLYSSTLLTGVFITFRGFDVDVDVVFIPTHDSNIKFYFSKNQTCVVSRNQFAL